MARYFFHVQCNDHLIEDPEGTDLPDETAALDEAVQSVRLLVADALAQGRKPTGRALIVADEQGREIDLVRFRDVVSAALAP